MMNDRIRREPPTGPADPHWSQSVADVAAQFQVDLATGLASSAAAARLSEFGPNSLRESASRSRLRAFLAQFADWMIGLLLAAAAVSGAIGEWGDAALIVAIVLVNAVIGFTQEQRAERAVAALRQMAQPVAHAWRDGHLVELPISELVPGDLVTVAGGTLVPADGRIAEGADLQANESPLTGEAMPVEKDSRPTSAETMLPDRTSMLYAGTAVVRGRGKMVVTATGMATELGNIASLLESTQFSVTPLQRRLARLSKQLAGVVVVVCAIIFVTGIARGNPVAEMFLVAVSLAVAAIPEGLPAVITIALALGSQRMSRRKAIVRQLSAVETLGSVNVICSDKTGTLTQNKMSVREIVPHGDDEELRHELLLAAAICNDAQFSDGQWMGSATELALAKGAEDAGLPVVQLRQEFARVAEFPFNSDRKRMSTLHRTPDGPLIAYIKGAPEAILRQSTALAVRSGSAPLTDEQRRRLERQVSDLAGLGRRVVGLAKREWTGESPAAADTLEQDLEFLGLMAILDPPRPEVAASIAACRAAGIQPVMITGDHASTAVAIGSELGLFADGDEVLDGQALSMLDDRELMQHSARTTIYARVSPEHKLRIVRAHQARGASVAMTGDGVNDAPALKQADIGVAMGITGTDVSKEVARIILADDNFATIVAAIEEGRGVYDNIRKCVAYLLTANASEILVIFVAISLGWPLPLLPIHLLWINLVTDGLPALALAYEAKEPATMRRRPRPRGESIFADGLGLDIVLLGGLMALVALALYRYLLTAGGVVEPGEAEIGYARTGVFVCLSLMQLLYVLALRSTTESVFRSPPWRNWRLVIASAIGVALQLLIVFFAPLQSIFHTTAPSRRDLGWCVAAATIPFCFIELRKGLRSLWQQRPAE